MKFLVTGAAGFIGFHVTKRLCEQGHDVVGIDNLNDYYDVNLKLARLAELEQFTDSKATSSNGCPIYKARPYRTRRDGYIIYQ